MIAGNHLPVIDGAGWHKAGDLKIPENMSLMFIPPYSPELKPVENVWQFLRQTYLLYQPPFKTTHIAEPWK